MGNLIRSGNKAPVEQKNDTNKKAGPLTMLEKLNNLRSEILHERIHMAIWIEYNLTILEPYAVIIAKEQCEKQMYFSNYFKKNTLFFRTKRAYVATMEIYKALAQKDPNHFCYMISNFCRDNLPMDLMVLKNEETNEILQVVEKDELCFDTFSMSGWRYEGLKANTFVWNKTKLPFFVDEVVVCGTENRNCFCLFLTIHRKIEPRNHVNEKLLMLWVFQSSELWYYLPKDLQMYTLTFLPKPQKECYEWTFDGILRDTSIEYLVQVFDFYDLNMNITWNNEFQRRKSQYYYFYTCRKFDLILFGYRTNSLNNNVEFLLKLILSRIMFNFMIRKS
ncbi:hypothetical protein RFI_20265 [Reticulomyxa filosa]|uniref:Uncharacterized protein n=1 Tax=Reticulomyxa filosa TaxID=46433 RepID=X6MTA3_RETFI|nr:hypothetical protein RFI_20265 [Reticulomyxa filosa]|eukprot:ETO17069.1 hypothetical protein RFI_20265 [Reticulomyxa filosa]